MKTAFSLLAVVTCAVSPAMGQEQTLISGRFESGGFGAPVVRFSEIRDQFAVLVGGRGGWILNHQFVLGAAGYGLASDIQVGGTFPTRDIEFGYGGLDLEYIHRSNDLVHLTLQTLIGGGGVEFVFSGETDVVFVFEPQANIEINITPYFRINAGAGYRFVTDVDLLIQGDRDFSAPYASIAFKFGKF